LICVPSESGLENVFLQPKLMFYFSSTLYIDKRNLVTWDGTDKGAFTCMCSHVIIHFMSFQKWFFIANTICPFTNIGGLYIQVSTI
jgi:hypothetical protein